MKILIKTLILGGLLAGLSIPALAQLDEIIVTATKRVDSSPGIFLETKGDYLLLEVRIENDSRGIATRFNEISETVDNFISASRKDSAIELSIVDDGFVRPLSKSNFKSGIMGGNRPDTSVAYLKVKTKIPDTVGDSYKLATKLGAFVDSIDKVGRTVIETEDEISVSVVNPYQYRQKVMDLVIIEINDITARLGPDYRAVITGLDKDVKWTRSGDLNLAFHIPYEFQIYPTSISTIIVPDY